MSRALMTGERCRERHCDIKISRATTTQTQVLTAVTNGSGILISALNFDGVPGAESNRSNLFNTTQTRASAYAASPATQFHRVIGPGKCALYTPRRRNTRPFIRSSAIENLLSSASIFA